jgi:hypothetical protein
MTMARRVIKTINESRDENMSRRWEVDASFHHSILSLSRSPFLQINTKEGEEK